MKIFLLWFHEYESSSVLGVFETKEDALRWREYFYINPEEKYTNMKFYIEDESDRDDYEDRFEIEERTIGTLHPSIKVDNLEYMKLQYEKKQYEKSSKEAKK